MTQDPYFARKEVSNSMLSALKSELSGKVYPDPVEAYFLGTMVDYMITEPEKIKDLMGDPLFDKFYDICFKMSKLFVNDPRCKAIIKNAAFQKISIGRRQFNHKGIDFELDCRCKWDFFGHVSGDIKSTTATTQKQFVAACHHFDYFRSRAWYMDLENTNRDIIIGISKKNYKIFYVPIIRDSELYNLGKEQYTDLAFKHWCLADSV